MGAAPGAGGPKYARAAAPRRAGFPALRRQGARAPPRAIQSSTARSRTVSGTEPWSRTTMWNWRMSKRSPRRRFRPVAQLDDLQLADHVAERLARPRQVAVDLGGDVGARPGRCARPCSRSPAGGSSPTRATRCRRPAARRGTPAPAGGRSGCRDRGTARGRSRASRHRAPSLRRRRCSPRRGETSAARPARWRARSAGDGPGPASCATSVSMPQIGRFSSALALALNQPARLPSSAGPE